MTASEWRQVRLADLCEAIDYGYTESAKAIPLGPRFLRITDIVGGHIAWQTVPFCEIDSETVGKYRLHHDDIVIARTGATTGVSAYISHPPEAVFASYLVRLKMGKNANARYISFFLRSPEFWAYMRGVLGDKSAQPNASAKTLTQVRLRLPPLSEQEAIAHILSTLDEKIDLNRRMNETLEAMARAIFKSWFVDFDPVRAKMEGRQPVGMDAETAALFPDSLEESALGMIPEGWKVDSMAAVATNPRRIIDPDSVRPDTPYIGLEHMPRHSIALEQWAQASDVTSAKARFYRNELLFGKLRPYFHKVGVAPVDGVCSTDILIVTPKTPQWLGFVLGHLSSPELVNHADACSTGTKMPRVGWMDIARYEVALPPGNLASIFTSHIRPSVDRIQCHIMESRTLAAIRDTLLPKLLSGEIRVREAETVLER